MGMHVMKGGSSQCDWGSFPQREKAWSNYLQNKTLINQAAVFSLQGVNKLHMRDTKGVRKFSVQTRAGLNDLLISLGNTYFQEYDTQIFHNE